MKGFPNRTADALEETWDRIKKEIGTVSPLPEAVRVSVTVNFRTTEQRITLIELVKLVTDRRVPTHGAAVDPTGS